MQQEARPGRAGLAADSALALALAVVLTVATYFVSQHRASVRPFDPGGAALVIASAVALAARRTRPVAVLAVVFGIVLAYLATGYPDGPIWLTLIIAFFTAVLYGHRLAGVAAGHPGRSRGRSDPPDTSRRGREDPGGGSAPAGK